ncbi:MAG TPA: YbaY family lipoprotein [Candidatus Acidoferrales bacterium]
MNVKMNMKTIVRIAGTLALMFLALPFTVLAQAPLTENAAGVVTGVATYRERMAMPKDAVLEATLSDVSKMDAPAEAIGSAVMENPGNPPYHFSITYDPRRIVENHSYAVRATIKTGGQLAFTSDTSYPVITRGAGKEVNILLKRVAKTTATAASANTSRGLRLEDTTWKLTRLGAQDVAASENQRVPYIVLDSSNKRVSGSGGCNRLNGSYTLDKQTIHFGPIASTMMACPSGMDLEGNFLHALDKSHSWKIQGNELELQDEDGAFLLRFEAGPSEK